MTIGQNIKTIRNQKGISQKKLADASGVGIATIQRIEYGQFTPKRDTIHKIAKALNVNDTELDDSLKEMIDRWDSQDTVRLSKKVQVWESITELFDKDTATFFQDFLSLNPEGQQKASEYMEFLMQKYKENRHPFSR